MPDDRSLFEMLDLGEDEEAEEDRYDADASEDDQEPSTSGSTDASTEP